MLKDFSKEAFDIIILAGQSNAEGYGIGDIEKPYHPKDNIWFLADDFYTGKECYFIPAAERVKGNEVQSDFGIIFAQRYIEGGMLEEGRKVLIVRAAVGSTGFLNGRWRVTDDLYLRMINMVDAALSLNSENRLVAMLWHQGENDVGKNATFEVHYGHLRSLLDSVRERFGAPALPFVAGDFVHHWKESKGDACTPVVEATKAVCRDCGNAGFVETDGLLSNIQQLDRLPWSPKCWRDNVHFSRRSVYELGNRYFDAFLNIRNGTL